MFADMLHTIYAAQFEQTIIHQHVLLRWDSQSLYIYGGKFSRNDTIILCLHVLIGRRILLILDMLIIFIEYRCKKTLTTV